MSVPANWWHDDVLPGPTAADHEPPPIVWMREAPAYRPEARLEPAPRGRGFGVAVWLLTFTATLAIAPGFTLWLAERIAP